MVKHGKTYENMEKKEDDVFSLLTRFHCLASFLTALDHLGTHIITVSSFFHMFSRISPCSVSSG